MEEFGTALLVFAVILALWGLAILILATRLRRGKCQLPAHVPQPGTSDRC
jgi:hypothetical protein